MYVHATFLTQKTTTVAKLPWKFKRKMFLGHMATLKPAEWLASLTCVKTSKFVTRSSAYVNLFNFFARTVYSCCRKAEIIFCYNTSQHHA